MIREAPTVHARARLVCPRCHHVFRIMYTTTQTKPAYVEHKCERGPDIALIVTLEVEND